MEDVFENFRKMCLKNYRLAGLVWWAALKKTEFKLELLANIDMILMVEEEIRGGICNAIHWYAKANNKYTKGYDRNKKSSYVKHWDVNNLYGWAKCCKIKWNS